MGRGGGEELRALIIMRRMGDNGMERGDPGKTQSSCHGGKEGNVEAQRVLSIGECGGTKSPLHYGGEGMGDNGRGNET